MLAVGRSAGVGERGPEGRAQSKPAKQPDGIVHETSLVVVSKQIVQAFAVEEKDAAPNRD